MESGVFLPALDHFMLSPLVTWVSSVCRDLQQQTSLSHTITRTHTHYFRGSQVRTFVPHDGGAHLDFSELLDGVLLNDVMMQM